jgi:RNA-dependent RNA polymerase
MTVSSINGHSGIDEIGRVLGNMHFDNSTFRLPHQTPIGLSPRQAKAQHFRETNDVLNYQFWPRAVGMGTLVGRRFVQVGPVRARPIRANKQMFGAECAYGRDTARDEEYTSPHDNRALPAQMKDRGWGKSYLAFDFRRECLVIKSKLSYPDSTLPAALRPIDAELSFDDIASQGISIEETGMRRQDPRTGELQQEIIVTVSIRRPPKFYTDFEESDKLPSMNGKRQSNKPYRRRATAMDFAMGSTVSLGCVQADF